MILLCFILSEATPSIVENILNEIKVIHPPVTNENRELYEVRT